MNDSADCILLILTPASGEGVSNLLLESGDDLLLEDGVSVLLLES